MLHAINRVNMSCTNCTIYEVPQTPPVDLFASAYPLMPMPIPSPTWSQIATKFITYLLNSQVKTVTMMVMHYFSISIKFIQLLELPSAFKMAKLVFKHVFHYFGIPEDIVSD